MNWEIELLQKLQSIRTPFLTAFMEAVSFMSESLFIVFIIATLYWCINKEKVTRMAWIVLVSGVANGVIKNIFKAPRPFQKGVVKPMRLETATSYSFPSGHTQSATSFWSSLYLVLRTPGILLVGAIVVILTAVSRLYLGVHWPVDVIGAIVIGLIVVVIADKLYDEKEGFTNWHVIGVSVVAFILLIVPVDPDLNKATGALWGLVVGGYLEQKAIRFKVEGNWKKQLMKILIGFGGTVGIYAVLSMILPEIAMMDMIKYAIILLYIAAGAPYLFKTLLEGRGKY